MLNKLFIKSLFNTNISLNIIITIFLSINSAYGVLINQDPSCKEADYKLFIKRVNNIFEAILDSTNDTSNFDIIVSTKEQCLQMSKVRKYERFMMNEFSKKGEEKSSHLLPILRNFSEDVIISGELGMKAIDRKKKLLFDFDQSRTMFGAYLGALKENKYSNGTIKLNDLIMLREQSLSFKDDHSKKNPDSIYKNQDTSTIISGELNHEVINKLQNYGFKIGIYNKEKNINTIPLNVQEKNKNTINKKKFSETSYTSVEYVSVERNKQNIQQYLDTLNMMIKEKKDIEEILAYAVQELLIIHPFDDGNGRVARLLGQIIMNQLTGKIIVFPEEFKNELNYSHQELAQILKELKTCEQAIK